MTPTEVRVRSLARLMVKLEMDARQAAERGNLSLATEVLAQRERIATTRSQLLLQRSSTAVS